MLRAGRMVPAVNRLGGGTIAMAGSTQPWRVVGSDAVVYQLRQASGRVLALRCLLGDTTDPALADRYRTLGTDLTIKRLRSVPSTPIVAEITYLAEGLSFPAADFRSVHQPVIAMEWVMGPTLIAAVDRACRSGDRPYLAALAAAWLTMMEALAAVDFVHGNLTGDNAMVRPREGFALVDYDTAFWPGAPRVVAADPNPGYRQPRGPCSVPERRDDFAALVIYGSLRVLAEWPDLREAHGEPASQPGGALLFSPRDLAQPDASALFGKLRVIDQPEVQALVGILREACLVKGDAVPPFREAVRAALKVSRTRPLARASSFVDPLERQQRLTRLNGLLLAGDVDAARRYFRSSGLADDPEAARELGPRIAEIERRRTAREAREAREPAEPGESFSRRPTREREQRDELRPAGFPPPVAERAPRRSDAIERLRTALESGDAAAVGVLWPEVRGEPDASLYAIQATEVLSKLLGAAIAGAIERGDDAATVAAVKDAETKGLAVGVTARRAGRAAAGRIETRRGFDRAIAADDREALAALAISGHLDELGQLDQAKTQAVIRALHWPHLARALTRDDDEAIAASYDPKVFAEPNALTAEQRRRIQLAQERIAWLDRVRAALRRREVAALSAALDDIPPGADRRLSRVERDRITRLLARHRAVARLGAALHDGSDTAIVDALNEVEAAGATLPEELDWAAVRGVVDRLSLAAAIRRAATTNPPDYGRLARLLPAARAASGDATPYLGANLDFAQLEDEVHRAAHRARLREAIAYGDDKAIVAAAVPDLYGTRATLSPEERVRVERAIANHRGSGPLRAPAPRGGEEPDGGGRSFRST